MAAAVRALHQLFRFVPIAIDDVSSNAQQPEAHRTPPAIQLQQQADGVTDLLADRDAGVRRRPEAHMRLTARVPAMRSWHGSSTACQRVPCSRLQRSTPPPRTSPTMTRSGRCRRGLQQFADRDCRQIALRAPRLKAHDVRLVNLQLCSVLNDHNPITRRNERRQRIKQRRLAGAGSATDQDVLAFVDQRCAPDRVRLP